MKPRVNSPDRESADRIPQREGTDEEVPGVVLGTDKNVGILTMFAKDGDDDAGWLVFRRRCSSNRYDALPWERVRWMSPVKHPISSDWMERLREWGGNWLSQEERIVKFG